MAATKTIVQRITLDGGADIQKQFAAIGAAGKKAFADIQSAASAAPTVKAFNSALSDLEAKAEAVGVSIGRFAGAMGNLASAASATIKPLAIIGGGALAVGGSILAIAKSAATATTELDNQASQVGLTTQEYQTLSGAFSAALVSGDDLTKGLVSLSHVVTQSVTQNQQSAKRYADLFQLFTTGKLTIQQYSAKLLELNQTTTQTENVFARLGISLKNSDGTLKDNRTILLDVADAFAKLPDGVQKTSDAYKIFQQNGTQFIKTLDGGRAGIVAMEAETRRIAPPLQNFQKQIGNDLTAAFAKLSSAAASTKNSFGLIFAPALTSVVNAVTEAIVANRLALFNVGQIILTSIQPAVTALIASLSSKEGSAFLTAAAEQAAIFGTAVTHAVTDIIIPAFALLIESANGVAATINAIFGTSFSGEELLVAATVLRLVGVFSLLGPAITAVTTFVGIFVTAFGAVPVALFAVGIAIGVAIVALSNFITSSTTLQTTVTAVWASITGTIGDAVQSVEDAFSSAIDGIGGFFSGLADDVVAGFNRIISLAKQAASAVASVFGGGSGDGATPQGFAGGGPIRGPGTGTSDSIPIMASSGEYMVRQKAVSHYGVGLLNAINSMRLPISALRNLDLGSMVQSLSSVMPGRTHFAMGGPIVAAAGGGSGGIPVNIHFGGVVFSVRADADVVKSLARVSSKNQMANTGRKPSWFK